MAEWDRWTRTPWHLLPVERRTSSFDEVAPGFSPDEVALEAARCVSCASPLCVDGCPNGNPIPDFIALAQEGRFLEAAAVDYLRNALPACTGRVCAWEAQCEGACVLNVVGEGVRIGAIERFIADYALRHREELETLLAEQREAGGIESGGPEGAPGASVAVVGSGPAGLSCAHFLTLRHVPVVVFEADTRLGGLLNTGIPEFVLPSGTVEQEVERLDELGVVFLRSTALGRDITLEELRHEFNAVFLAVGASRARKGGLPGEEARGVWTAQAFLWQAKAACEPATGQAAPPVGQRVLVVGAGNTAIDAARTAVRLGAADVRVVYRRTAAESPARHAETEHAVDEGIRFEYLVNPVAYLSDPDGRLTASRLVRMRLGAPDRSGRPRPEPIPGSEFELPCDTVVLALGYGVDEEALGGPSLLDSRTGLVRVNGEDGRTDVDGVFSGGDAVRGPATVVEAVRDGRLAAEAIAAYLASRAAAGLKAD